jgi:hypothetical protein
MVTTTAVPTRLLGTGMTAIEAQGIANFELSYYSFATLEHQIWLYLRSWKLGDPFVYTWHTIVPIVWVVEGGDHHLSL